MKTSSVGRLRGAGLVTALTAACLLAVPSPSHAGVLDTPQTQTGIGFNGSGSCTQTGAGNTSSPVTPFAADGVPVTTTSSSSATYTHNVDNTDVTTMTGTVSNTVTATQAGGALRTLDVHSTSLLTLAAAKGTAQACNASVSSQLANVAVFDLPSPKYVTARITSNGSFGAVVIQSSLGPIGGIFQTVNFFLHSDLTQRVYLPAGTWMVQLQAQSVIQAPTPSLTMASPRPGEADLYLTFDEPGAAAGAAKGDAGAYVDLAAGRTCGDGSLSATWKRKAGKGDKRTVKKAVFRVDGAKVKTVKKPTKKQVTTLIGLDPEEMAVVSVTLKLVKKGAGKPTVERSYLACT